MKTNSIQFTVALVITAFVTQAFGDDPRTNSWFTTYSGRYARMYTNNVAKTNGISSTTWGNGSQNQTTPAYSGIQEVYSSSNYVYFRTTGLGQHTMGPWYNDATITTLFINLPKNSKTLYRIPRNPTVPGTKTLIGGGTIAYTVDGLSVFDSRDALAWNGSTEAMSGNTTGGLWWRDAWPNEGVTFDPGLAHQPQDGTYHYHANPLATRYLLGDHVDFNSTSKMFTESTNAVTKHSPIIGWVPDGFPLYGPYGYSSASNSASGLRRMVSGYVLRNGSNGTDNLTNSTTATVPAWALRAYNVTSGLIRPTVASGKPVSRYTEDYAYLGDLTNSVTGTNYLKGTDFDLDEWNGRWCYTPEFPNGTYAYFTTIKADGSVAFPYIIGRQYYGTLSGGSVGSVTETVVTNFVGGPNLRETMNTPAKSGSTVTLTWSAVEGGTYRVESSTNLTTWTTNATGIAAVLNTGSNSLTSTDTMKFFRVNRTAIAAYDGIPGGSGGSFVAPGGSVSLGSGTNITITITLPTNPPNPPANAPITSVTLAGVAGTSVSYATQGTVIASFALLSGTPTGTQNISIQFQNGPVQPYLVSFTINP